MEAWPPDDQGGGHLPEREGGVERPQHQQHVGVGVVGAVHAGAHRGAEHVEDEQRRNSDPEQQLDGFGEGCAPAVAPVDRVIGEGDVDQNAREEDRAGRSLAPESEKHDPASLHDLERNEAQGMVQQVGSDEERHHQAAREAEVAGGAGAHHPPDEAGRETGQGADRGGFDHGMPADRFSRRMR